MFEAATKAGCHICYNPVLTNGRIELLHYSRELSTSIDYHRYGNLGSRETELRKPILQFKNFFNGFLKGYSLF